MKWETRLHFSAALLATATLAVLPLLGSALGLARLLALPASLAGWLASRTVELVTGYAALVLVAAAMSLSLRLRTRMPLPYPRGSARAIHMVLGTLPLAAVYLHTCGNWGVHLNRALLNCFLLAVFVALTGKLAENGLLRRLAALACTARGERSAATVAAALAAKLAAQAPLSAAPGVAARRVEVQRLAGLERQLRAVWPRLHLLLVAAMLVLVAFHVLGVYFYP